jgi:hypothetical protein
MNQCPTSSLSTTSISSFVGKTVSIHQTSTLSSRVDSKIVVGGAHNTVSGDVMAFQSNKQGSIFSDCETEPNINMDLVYSEGFIGNDTRVGMLPAETEMIVRGSLKKLSRKAPNADPAVLREYLLAFDCGVQWERSLERRFNENDQLIISYYLTFFGNEYEGYGDQNEPWNEITEKDLTGKLLQEAQIGWSLMKRVTDIFRAHQELAEYQYIENPRKVS